MQKTIVNVSNVLDDATSFQKKMHRKYNGKIRYVRRNIDFDIKHGGVTRGEVIAFLDKIQNDSSFSDIRKSEGSRERIKELQIEKK